MNEPKTQCTSCGCEILRSTADRNQGLCAPCQRRLNAPPARIRTPVPGVSRAGLDELIEKRSRDAVIDALFDPACDKVNFRPWEMTEGDVVVYTVWTFLGETLNGGFEQYLTNQSGSWAHLCGSSLRKIGADEYAEIMETCIKAFTDAEFPQDPRWQTDLENYCDELDEPFEELGNQFGNLFDRNRNELRDLLYNYICAHREVFAASDAGA